MAALTVKVVIGKYTQIYSINHCDMSVKRLFVRMREYTIGRPIIKNNYNFSIK